MTPCPICGHADLGCNGNDETLVCRGDPIVPGFDALGTTEDGARVYRRAPARAAPDGAVLIEAIDVRPQPVAWLWPGYLPLGKLSLLCGDPGLGKSLVALHVAACVTGVRPWPDGAMDGATGGVLLLSAEDDGADTVRPRLDAAGADVAAIALLTGVTRLDPDTGQLREDLFTLPGDLAALDAAIGRVKDCRLVVIDPLAAFLPAGRWFDSHRNADVRAVLAPLAALAARHEVALLAVHHLRKGGGDAPALHRVIGSIAFTAAARVVHMVLRDPDDDTRRLFVSVKNNIGAEPPALAFRIVPAKLACRLEWEQEPVHVRADEVLARRGGDRARADADEAGNFVRQALAGGKRPARDVIEAARTCGLSRTTVYRRFKELGGVSECPRVGADALWSLPGVTDAGPASPVSHACTT